MRLKSNLLALALATIAAPVSAQIVVRDDPGARRPAGGTVGDIIFDDSRVDTESRRRASAKIPPGHLPPRGMCRVWIDGVPPGQQPRVTTCAQAESDRLRQGVNARVIYGDRETFRGRANGKFKNKSRDRSCQIRDAVVVDGRVVNVCSDDRVQNSRRGRGGDDDDRFDDDDDDDDREDKRARKASRPGKGRR